jgi:hypothetical protein
MEKFWPSMEYRNKFFQLSEDGKFLPQYGIILIGTSFQTLHAHTLWFGPKRLLKSRTGFSSQFFSLLKNLPQFGVNSLMETLIINSSTNLAFLDFFGFLGVDDMLLVISSSGRLV